MIIRRETKVFLVLVSPSYKIFFAALISLAASPSPSNICDLDIFIQIIFYFQLLHFYCLVPLFRLLKSLIPHISLKIIILTGKIV